MTKKYRITKTINVDVTLYADDNGRLDTQNLHTDSSSGVDWGGRSLTVRELRARGYKVEDVTPVTAEDYKYYQSQSGNVYRLRRLTGAQIDDTEALLSIYNQYNGRWEVNSTGVRVKDVHLFEQITTHELALSAVVFSAPIGGYKYYTIRGSQRVYRHPSNKLPNLITGTTSDDGYWEYTFDGVKNWIKSATQPKSSLNYYGTSNPLR